MKITDALLAEHQVYHNIFDHIESAVPKMAALGEVKVMAALMEKMLKAHSDTEDELFLGPLEHCFEQIGQRDSFVQEHQEIDGHLRLVQKSRRLKEAQQLLLAAVANSRQHFDREERIVFPMAENVLKNKTLTDLANVWRRHRTRVTV